MNPRSQEGRALMREKGALYTDWKETERAKAKAVAAWYRARNEAAYAQSPDALIDVAVADADRVLQEQCYSSQNYPQNQMICSIDGTYDSEEQMFTHIGSMLNRFTEVSNQEHMCNVYMIEDKAGKISYAASAIYTGEYNNVINPYLKDPFGVRGANRIIVQYAGSKIHYMGMLHAHPNDRKTDNDQFSWGDGLVAAASGKIYLTTPHGNVYALDRLDGSKVVLPGMLRETMLASSKAARKLGVSDYLWNPLLRLYMDYAIDKHDEWVRGSNFETVEAKTYNVK